MDLSPTLDFVIRLLVASLVGAVIGFERKYRAKGAGIGTHVLVAIGAALFMIVSQHGFDGAPRFDAARVAAGVVSGIGFLGGGIILKQQNRVSGLTTAAGLWVTAAMGLAVGSGMYILGAASVLIVLLWADITHLLTRKVGKRQVTVSLTSNDKTALKDALQSLGKGVETGVRTGGRRDRGRSAPPRGYSRSDNSGGHSDGHRFRRWHCRPSRSGPRGR